MVVSLAVIVPPSSSSEARAHTRAATQGASACPITRQTPLLSTCGDSISDKDGMDVVDSVPIAEFRQLQQRVQFMEVWAHHAHALNSSQGAEEDTASSAVQARELMVAMMKQLVTTVSEEQTLWQNRMQEAVDQLTQQSFRAEKLIKECLQGHSKLRGDLDDACGGTEKTSNIGFMQLAGRLSELE
eukprot:5161335-Amphidinium_carterae.1